MNLLSRQNTNKITNCRLILGISFPFVWYSHEQRECSRFPDGEYSSWRWVKRTKIDSTVLWTVKDTADKNVELRLYWCMQKNEWNLWKCWILKILNVFLHRQMQFSKRWFFKNCESAMPKKRELKWFVALNAKMIFDSYSIKWNISLLNQAASGPFEIIQFHSSRLTRPSLIIIETLIHSNSNIYSAVNFHATDSCGNAPKTKPK